MRPFLGPIGDAQRRSDTPTMRRHAKQAAVAEAGSDGLFRGPSIIVVTSRWRGHSRPMKVCANASRPQAGSSLCSAPPVAAISPNKRAIPGDRGASSDRDSLLDSAIRDAERAPACCDHERLEVEPSITPGPTSASAAICSQVRRLAVGAMILATVLAPTPEMSDPPGPCPPPSSLRSGGAALQRRRSSVQQTIGPHRSAAETRREADLRRPSVPVVDELGHLPMDGTCAHCVLEVVSRGYERRSIVLTYNRAFGDWGAISADGDVARDILESLLHHAKA